MMTRAYRLAQTMSASLKDSSFTLRRHWVSALAVSLCVAGVMVRLAPIAASRFHQDEAIYGYWALQVVTGRDPWLSHCAVDKPPLYIYCLVLFMQIFGHSETVVRLPGELSSAASLLLLYLLAKRLYDHRVGLAALTIAAFSPFNILFAPTAFTDPVMVAWVLGALLAVAYRRWGWSALLAGLGVITKPTAIMFLPLIAAVGVTVAGEPSAAIRPGKAGRPIVRFAAAFSLVLIVAALWDMIRAAPRGFLQQSIVSYGGLRLATVASWPERLGQWSQFLSYFTGSRLLNLILLIGLPILLGYALLHWRTGKSERLDWFLALFAAGFVIVHTIFDFNVWDRYLLGLVPVISLLLARVLLLPLSLYQRYVKLPASGFWPGLGGAGECSRQGNSSPGSGISHRTGHRKVYSNVLYGSGLAILLFSTLLRPAQDAASSRYPIGGAHGTYNGIDALVSYIRGNVPGGAVMYHQWLGWHYSFYLFDFPYLFQWYTTASELAEDASHRPGALRYVAFPSWRSATTYRWTLKQAGLNMSPIYETYRDDGTRSFTLYRIEETARDG